MKESKYIVLAFSESGDKDFSCASSLASAEQIALEFAKEGYFPEVYKLGEYIPVKAVEDFLDSEYSDQPLRKDELTSSVKLVQLSRFRRGDLNKL